MKKVFFIAALSLSFYTATAQTFTRRDSLQGGLRPERTSFDVQRYDLNIKVDTDKKYISGYNNITFKVTENTAKIQLDLFENMAVDSIVYNKTKLAYKRDNGAVFITFPKPLNKGSEEQLRFYYSGKPTVAVNAPWDGGFVFAKDDKQQPWIGVAVQGTGSSLCPARQHLSRAQARACGTL